MMSQFTVMSKLIDVQFSSPGLRGVDEVVPDWIKIQSFVSVDDITVNCDVTLVGTKKTHLR